MYGAVADDFTGATDLAGNWRSRGLRTTVLLGVPGAGEPTASAAEHDAVVLAQKIRSIDPGQARAAARAAGEHLLGLGCSQLYDKYCSTFDSTPEGNIGPIADELSALTGASHAVVVPSFPGAGRTVYQGHLFVFDQLLDESPMRHHPLNPMTDSSLARLLTPQTDRPITQIGLAEVRQGADTLRERIRAAAQEAHYIVVDAIDNSDLAVIAAATANDALVTGGSGIALGMPQADRALAQVRAVAGRKLVLSGSASAMTQQQVQHAQSRMPAWRADIDKMLADPAAAVAETVDWIVRNWQSNPDAPVLVYSVADPADVTRARAATAEASAHFERFFADVVAAAAPKGLGQLIVAGGETSGSVVEALGIGMLDVGDQLAPGVSWLLGSSASGFTCNLVLKSGNFGAVSLFTDAWSEL